jgi:hypothetical protein
LTLDVTKTAKIQNTITMTTMPVRAIFFITMQWKFEWDRLRRPCFEGNMKGCRFRPTSKTDVAGSHITSARSSRANELK